jgi:hypothetical protein
LYAHLEADTGEIFYIGRGETPGRPWAINCRTAKHKNRIKKHGLKVEIITEPHLTWGLSGWWECWWIAACRAAGFDLVNLTDGGDGTRGYKPPKEVVARKAAIHSEFMSELFSSERGKLVKNQTSQTLLDFLETPEGQLWGEEMRQIKLAFYATPAGDLWKTENSLRRYNFLNSEAGRNWSNNRKDQLAKFFETEEGERWCDAQSFRLTEFYATDAGKAAIEKAIKSREAFYNSPEGELWKIQQSEKVKESLKKPSARWKLLLRDWHRSNVRPHNYWGA